MICMLELPASENMATNKAEKQGFVKFSAVTLGPDRGKKSFQHPSALQCRFDFACFFTSFFSRC